ncbi:polyunsaturated fatty acid elongation enzyme [Phlyctochytrium arcticum]|nr:polyunsaturated fatty acid elongation enzyme [Phlyctochytrium arcticum]
MSLANATTIVWSPRVEDTLISIGQVIGQKTAPFLDPLEAQLVAFAKSKFPAAASFCQTWLANHQSVHAAKLPLMNPFHVLVIVLAYFAMVFGGKLVMSGLGKFEAKKLTLAHNLFLLSLSGYMCVEILKEARRMNYDVVGNPANESKSGFPMAKLVWLFYVSKIFEFVDTMIMVLKKNHRQISFLHVYHHFSIFTVWWLVTYWAPTGEAYFSAALNSFIHVVMYGYYFCMGAGIRQVAFVKRYITSMQMTQFCCMMGQAVYNMYASYSGKADTVVRPPGHKTYPIALSTLLFWYMWTMLGLFANYLITDMRRAGAAKKAARAGSTKKRN